MGTILLEDMTFHAFHGVLPEEQIVGNKFSVTIRLVFDFSRAAQSDDLSDTVNYAEIYELIKREMQQKSKLIEHVAQRILNAVLLQFPQIQEIEVRLSKHNPPVAGEVAKSTVIISYPEN